MSHPIRIAPKNARRPNITPATIAANPERLHARHIAYEASTATDAAASTTLIAFSISPVHYNLSRASVAQTYSVAARR